MSDINKRPNAIKCAHIDENQAFVPGDLFIFLDAENVLLLCRQCRAIVEASILHDIVEKAIREVIPHGEGKSPD